MPTDIPVQFWLQNAHFVLYVFAALGLFAVGWLNLDTYRGKPELKMMFRAVGCLVLALWALIMGAQFSLDWVQTALVLLEGVGIAALVVGFYLEPVPVIPADRSGRRSEQSALLPISFSTSWALLPVLGWIAVWWRVFLFSTKGLLRNYRGLASALAFFAFARLLSLASLFRSTDNVMIFNLTREYSGIWIVEHIALFIGAVLLLRWAFYYLSFRPIPQVFISFVATSLVVTVLTTVAFTSFLYGLTQRNSIVSLQRAAAVFEFSLNELKRQTSLSAYSIASRASIVEAVAQNEPAATAVALGDPLKEVGIGTMLVTNRSGEILAAVGSDRTVGESMVDVPIVSRALQGNTLDTTTTREQLDSRQLIVRSAYPIVRNATVLGVVIADYPVDQAFLDTVKAVTRLDVSLNIRREHFATTLVDENGRRITGTLITNSEVNTLIDTRRESWTWAGSEKLVDQDYLTAYRSLQDVDNTIIGSLMVGQDKIDLLDDVDRSLSLTFLSCSIILLLSLLPLHRVAVSVARAAQS